MQSLQGWRKRKYVSGAKGIEICSNGSGHMTDMAATPVDSKNFKLDMWHRYLSHTKTFLSNSDLGLTLTFFTAKSNIGKSHASR